MQREELSCHYFYVRDFYYGGYAPWFGLIGLTCLQHGSPSIQSYCSSQPSKPEIRCEV